MRKVLCCALIVFSFAGLVGCTISKDEMSSSEYFRIHIRANSNSMEDQNIKYMIKDSVVEYLSPLIAECEDKDSMMSVVQDNLSDIESVADDILRESGFGYTSTAYISEEYFPTRVYGDITLEAAVYDAIIVELGEGDGNNWWCVVYPPLCFVNAEETSTSGFRYKSKLMEIIKNFFD